MQEIEGYGIWVDTNGLIRFQTDENLDYYVTFSDTEGYFFDNNQFSSHFKEFSFNILDGSNRGKQDTRISNTLLNLINRYLINHPTHALFYQCSTADNQHAARNRMFRTWRKLLTPNSYYFIDFQIQLNHQGEKITIYSSLITREDNPLKTELLNAFEEVRESHNSYKI